MSRHNIRIEVGSRVFSSRVFLDGKEMSGVYAVQVAIDSRNIHNHPLVTLTLAPRELVIEGESNVQMVGRCSACGTEHEIIPGVPESYKYCRKCAWEQRERRVLPELQDATGDPEAAAAA